MTRAVRLTGALLGGVLALVAAGCGGGSDTTTTTASASEWASGFCGAFATWDQAFKDATSQFTSLGSLTQENFQSAADDIETATQQLIDDLKGLGAPDTESGQEIKDSIDALSTTLQTETDAIKTSVDDASGLTGYIDAAKEVSTSLGTMNDALQSTISTVQNSDAKGELEDALKSSPDCKSLTK